MKKIVFSLFILLIVSCNNKEKPLEVTQTTVPATEPLIDKPGIIGVINLPEILTLAIKDSANKDEIGFKMGKNYGILEAEMNELGLTNNEMPPGAIYYNNDINKFVFECLIPINMMPKIQPKHSSIVILEATRAVVYNYYGPYDKMFDAYDELKKYLEDNKMEQISAAREFYLSDPTTEKDPSKWLSKIYIPVK